MANAIYPVCGGEVVAVSIPKMRAMHLRMVDFEGGVSAPVLTACAMQTAISVSVTVRPGRRAR